MRRYCRSGPSRFLVQVEITLEDVALLARLRDSPDVEAHEARDRLQKRMRLDAEEVLRSLRQSAGRAAPPPAESLMSRLGRAIVDNVRLRLARLHVRYEDSTVATARNGCVAGGGSESFACGATMQLLEVCSTDVEWRPDYMRGTSRVWLHRLVTLEGLALYWDVHHAPRSGEPLGSPLHLPPPPRGAEVLSPADVVMQLRMLRAGAHVEPHEPRNSGTCHLRQRVELTLAAPQLHGLLQLSTMLARLAQRERFCRWREGPELDAAARWRFALRCVRADLQAQRRWHPWSAMQLHARRRREYLPLWQAHLRGEPLGDAAAQRLAAIEDELRLEHVLLFRALAQLDCHSPPLPPSVEAVRSPPGSMLRSASEGHLRSSGSPGARGARLRGPASANILDLVATAETAAGFERHAEDGNAAAASSSGVQRRVESPVKLRAQPPVARGQSRLGNASTPVEWRLDFELSSLLLRVCEAVPSPEHGEGLAYATSVLAELELALLRVKLHTDLAGRSSSDLSLGLVTVRDGGSYQARPSEHELGGARGGRLPPECPLLLEIRESADVGDRAADDEGGTAALSIAHEVWPATACCFPQGDSLHSRREAGSRVRVTTSHVKLCVTRTAIALVELLHAGPDTIGEMPEALVSATPADAPSAVEVTVGGLGVRFPGPECATDDLQLHIGTVELGTALFTASARALTPPPPPRDTSTSKAWFVPFHVTVQSVELQLVLDGNAATLVEPFSIAMKLQQGQLDGTAPLLSVSANISPLELELQAAHVAPLSRLASSFQTGSAEREARPSEILPTSPVRMWLEAELHIDHIGARLASDAAQLTFSTQRLDFKFTTSTGQRGEQLREGRAEVQALELLFGPTGEASMTVLRTKHVSAAHVEMATAGGTQIRSRITADNLQLDVLSSRAHVLTAPPLAVLVSPGVSDAICLSLSLEPDCIDTTLDIGHCQVTLGDPGTVARPVLRILTLSTQLASALGSALDNRLVVAVSAPKSTQTRSSNSLAVRSKCELLAVRVYARPGSLPDTTSDPSMSVDVTDARTSVVVDPAGCVDAGIELDSVSAATWFSVSGPDTLLRPVHFSARLVVTDSGSTRVHVELTQIHVTLSEGQLLGLVEIGSRSSLLVDALGGVDMASPPVDEGSLEETRASSTLQLDVSLQDFVLALVSGEASRHLETSAWVALHLVGARLMVRVCGDVYSVAMEMITCTISTGMSSHGSCFPAEQPTSPGGVLLEITRANDAAGDSIELRAAGTPLCGSRPNVSTEVQPGVMLINVAYPRVHIHVQLDVIADALPVIAPVLRVLSAIPMPAASDVPFVVDVCTPHFVGVLTSSHADSEMGFACRANLSFRLAMAGGVAAPAMQQASVMVHDLAVDYVLGTLVTPVLSPCNVVLRCRSGNVSRWRASVQCTDVQVQASYGLVTTATLLRERLLALQATDLGPQAVGLAVQRPPSSCSGSELASDIMSETSEYFDAVEFVEDLDEPPAAISDSTIGEETAQKPLTDVRVEMHVGHIAVTLVDDYHCLGTPLLQLLLSLQRAVAHKRGAASSLLFNLQSRVSLSHYKRQLHGAPQGWEPVLLPCWLDVGIDINRQTATIGSRGPLDFDVSACLLRSFLGLQERLLSAQHSASPATVPYAPFRLQNETGALLRYTVGGEPPCEVPASTGAALAEAPTSKPGVPALRVAFQGFQVIELRPPYRDRYRLWPTDHEGVNPPVFYVLAQSSLEGASELLTLRSPFMIKNCSPAQASLLVHSGDAPPCVMDLKSDELVAVPLSSLPASIEVNQPPLSASPLPIDAGSPGERLELAIAPLQSLRGRGSMLLGAGCTRKGSLCYSVTATYASCGWVISLHAPLLLHNGLLGQLEYELSESPVVSGQQPRMTRGRLEKEASVACFRPCRTGCYLRVRCGDFQWSQPVDVGAMPEVDSDHHTHSLRCSLMQPQVTAFAPADERQAPDLPLQMHLVQSPATVSVEICARIWVVNECQHPLHCRVMGPGTGSLRLPPGQCLPTSSGVAVPVPLSSSGTALPELLLSEVPPPESMPGLATNDAMNRGALLSLAQLLQSEARSEDFMVDVSSVVASEPSEPPALRSSVGLHLGARLLPVQHKLSSSMLLRISPRFVLINRTVRPLQCCQRDCQASPWLLQPCSEQSPDSWIPLHWHDAMKPHHLLLRRTDRGAEWSGGIPLGYTSSSSVPAEITLRLRNLETSATEFPRLSMQCLQGRATVAVVITDELPESAPMQIQNLTGHELRFTQFGVPVLCTLVPGASCRYAWDDPSGRKQIRVHIAALGVRFSCGPAASHTVRPWLASLRRKTRVELQVIAEGAVTRFVVREMRDLPLRSAIPFASWRSVTSTDTFGRGRRAESSEDAAMALESRQVWQLNMQLSRIGVTLLDDTPRELLKFSLGGFRVTLRSFLQQEVPAHSVALAIASLQLDCQLPRATPREEVLLEVGLAARRVDAIRAQAVLTSAHTLPVLQHAALTVQEITLRLDEEVIGTVVSVIQAQVLAKHIPPQPPSGAFATLWHRCTIGGELEQLIRNLEALGQRLFIERLRLGAVRLKLSLRSSRPDAMGESSGGGGTTAQQALSASLVRWLRWLGITLIGLEDAPVRLSEVVIQRVALPVESVLADIEQRYTNELTQQIQALLLPSAALLGDPYGSLRALRQGWLKQRERMRRAPWSHVPLLATQGLQQLLRATAAVLLRASEKSSLAISRGLEALLSADSDARVSEQLALPDAVLRGVGGLARETARGLDAALARAKDLFPVPRALEGPFLTLMLPYGLGRGLKRLVVLLALGTLRTIHLLADASRGLLHSGWLQTKTPGRARQPRVLAPMQLVHSCTSNELPARYALAIRNKASVQAESSPQEPAATAGAICCMELVDPAGVVIVTPDALRCLCHLDGAVLWEASLAEVLLVQQQGPRLRLLCMLPMSESPRSRSEQPSSTYIEARVVRLSSAGSAEELQELLRVAGLNARGVPLPPTLPCPTVRVALLAGLRPTVAALSDHRRIQ